MLLYLLYPLHQSISAFNVFRYITFRTIYASLTAFLICFFLGPWAIRMLSRLQIGQFVRDDGSRSSRWLLPFWWGSSSGRDRIRSPAIVDCNPSSDALWLRPTRAHCSRRSWNRGRSSPKARSWR